MTWRIEGCARSAVGPGLVEVGDETTDLADLLARDPRAMAGDGLVDRAGETRGPAGQAARCGRVPACPLPSHPRGRPTPARVVTVAPMTTTTSSEPSDRAAWRFIGPHVRTLTRPKSNERRELGSVGIPAIPRPEQMPVQAIERARWYVRVARFAVREDADVSGDKVDVPVADEDGVDWDGAHFDRWVVRLVQRVAASWLRRICNAWAVSAVSTTVRRATRGAPVTRSASVAATITGATSQPTRRSGNGAAPVRTSRRQPPHCQAAPVRR